MSYLRAAQQSDYTTNGDTRQTELDEIVAELAASLQLTDTQFNRAETSYRAVGKWLQAKDSPVSEYYSSIFPQGSLRLDTTVKPLKAAEFDLDLVCLLDWPRAKPLDLYDLLLDRMKDHGKYAPITRQNNRCIRLEYGGDFHLDIVPAIYDPNCEPGSTCILIPDREKKDFRPSNPKGYATWFEQTTIRQIKAAAELSRGDMEPLKAPVPYDAKKPLRITVQLLKRWRDVAFSGRMHLAPSSIVLTTLAGTLYAGHQRSSEALMSILDGICEWAQKEDIKLRNPSNDQEWITDRWHDKPEMYDAFVKGVTEFRSQWYDIFTFGKFPKLSNQLKELFEEQPVQAAMAKFASRRLEIRQDGKMGMERTTGRLATTTSVIVPAAITPVKPHRFFGQED